MPWRDKPRTRGGHGARAPPMWTRVLLLWSPLLVTAWLVKRHAVNTLLWDDWWLAEDWVKLRLGTFRWTELFSVQMEHRLVLPRAIALLLHGVFGSDIRAQNAMSLVLLAFIVSQLLRLLRRSVGPLTGWKWWLGFMIVLTVASPIQWQCLLWPIIFTMFLSVACTVGAISAWFSGLRPWTALVVAMVCAVLGTLTFANGMMSWFLMPLAIYAGRQDVAPGTRKRMLAAWAAAAAVTLGLYFHNFRNGVNPAYAYSQGEQVTVQNSAWFALLHPARFVHFVCGLLGSHLSRGWRVDNLVLAEAVGGISLLLLAGCLWIHWRRGRAAGVIFPDTVLPWVLLAGFSVGTACMIAMGRAWIGDSPAQAVTARYATHAVYLTAALIPLAAKAARHLRHVRPAAKAAGWMGLGVFLSWQATQWLYGTRQMEVWENSRYQDMARVKFCRIAADHRFMGATAGDAALGARLAIAMDDLRMSSNHLLTGPRLDQFKIQKGKLDTDDAGFEWWVEHKDGRIDVKGYARLPSGRPADLIVFTYQENKGREIIGGFCPLSPLPGYLSRGTRKDFEFTAVNPDKENQMMQWTNEVTLAGGGIPAKVTPTAWALDVKRKMVYRIPEVSPLKHIGVVRARDD